MKNLTTTILAILTSIFIANAATITVSNDVNSPGQYTDLQVAIDAPTTLSGDTILVAGSQNSYGSITISTKQIHLVGIGNDPMKQQAYKSEINDITFTRDNSNLALKSDGSTIQGFQVSSITIVGAGSTCCPLSALYSSNYMIFRCELASLGIGSFSNNVLIYNNVIIDISKGQYSNFTSNYIISNNIIKGDLQQVDYQYSVENASQFLIVKNNLFLSDNSTFSASLSGYNLVVHNNLFRGIKPVTYASNSEFESNLSFNHANDTFPITGTNSGSGNIIGQDPLFVSETDSVFQNTDDLNTPASSPVHNAGTDGTDIGIYGGAYPWPEGGISGSGFMYSQEPKFPQVNEMNISNLSVPVGGIINVTSKGIINH